jgi:hypothetical protein
MLVGGFKIGEENPILHTSFGPVELLRRDAPSRELPEVCRRDMFGNGGSGERREWLHAAMWYRGGGVNKLGHKINL